MNIISPIVLDLRKPPVEMQLHLQYHNYGHHLKTEIEHSRQKEPALDPNEENPTTDLVKPKDEVSDSSDPTFTRPVSSGDIKV